jgi:hypothetical protein
MAHSSPLPPVGAPVRHDRSTEHSQLSDTESDGDVDVQLERTGLALMTPTKMQLKGKKRVAVELGTPVVPSRYPNLETPTQVSGRVSQVMVLFLEQQHDPTVTRNRPRSSIPRRRILTTGLFTTPSSLGRTSRLQTASTEEKRFEPRRLPQSLD